MPIPSAAATASTATVSGAYRSLNVPSSMPCRTTSATSRRHAVLSRSASARISGSRMPKCQDSIHSRPASGVSGSYPVSDLVRIRSSCSHGSPMPATSASSSAISVLDACRNAATSRSSREPK